VSKTMLPAAITAIDFSDDGQAIAVAGSDNHVRLYQTSDARLVEDITSPSPAARLAMHAAGKCVILACADSQVRLHPWLVERLIAGHQGAVTALADVDNEHIVTGGADKTVRLWDAKTGREVRQFVGCTAGVVRVAVSHDQKLVAAVAEDRVVWVWQLADAKLLGSITSQTPVRALAFGGPSRLLAGGDDNLIRVYDLSLDPATPIELERMPGHTGAVLSLAADRDGNRVISGGGDNTARLWQTSVVIAGKAHVGPIHAVAWTSDGSRVFTSGEDKVVQNWELVAPKDSPGLQTLRPAHKFTGHTGVIRALAVSDDGALLAGAGDDQHVRVWNAKDGQTLVVQPTPAKLTSLVFSRDGRKLIAAGADNIIRNYAVQARDGKYELALIQESHGHTAAVAALSLSADGQWLYSVAADRTVRRWFSTSDEPRWSAAGHNAPVYGLAVGKGGTVLASASGDKTVRLWNARDGKLLSIIAGHEKAIYGLAFSPDGTRLASCGADGTVRIWDLAGKEGLRLADGVDDILTSVAFSANGQWLTAGSQSGQAHTWNLLAPEGPQKPAHSTSGHAHSVSRVAYNPSGSRRATLDYSGKFFLWNTGDGGLVYHQQLPSTIGYAMAYSPDGRELAAATRSHKVVIVALPPGVQ